MCHRWYMACLYIHIDYYYMQRVYCLIWWMQITWIVFSHACIACTNTTIPRTFKMITPRKWPYFYCDTESSNYPVGYQHAKIWLRLCSIVHFQCIYQSVCTNSRYKRETLKSKISKVYVHQGITYRSTAYRRINRMIAIGNGHHKSL